MILLSLLMIGYILWTLTNFGLLYEGNKSAWPVELTRSFEFLDDAEYDMLVFTPFLLAWSYRIVDALVFVIKSLPRILILNKWFPMSTTHVLMLKSVPMILVYNVKFGCIYSNQYVRIKKQHIFKSLPRHTCKKRGIAGIYPHKFFWIFRKILGWEREINTAPKPSPEVAPSKIEVAPS